MHRFRKVIGSIGQLSGELLPFARHRIVSRRGEGREVVSSRERAEGVLGYSVGPDPISAAHASATMYEAYIGSYRRCGPRQLALE
jgi:hypothetical protein